MKRCLGALAVILALVLPLAGWANPPAGFQSQTLLLNLNQPVALAFLPGGRMLVASRTGTIWVVQPGATHVDSVPFLKLGNILADAGERGLEGITLDPNFAGNGFFYVFYTCANPIRDRVSRFTAGGATASPASEKTIWIDTDFADYYHHGGGIAFGPDGKLYISTGDFASINSQAMNLASYRGKILRVNADGSIPTNNPFYDGSGPNLDAIWARGLRNPFRIAFDSQSGKMYIGDVGSNNDMTSIEEVNLGVAGANYGWPLYEGPVNKAGYTDPIFNYVHGGQGAAIILGCAYRGGNFPAAYQGSLFYGDYVRHWMRRLTLNSAGTAVTGSAYFEPANGSSNGPYGAIVDIRQGPDGALYYADIGDPYATPLTLGSVRKISYIGTNLPPVAAASSDKTQGNPPLTVHFSSAGSSDPQGKPLTYAWDLGNGATSSQANPTVTYTKKGRYLVRLTVSNGTLSTQAPVLVITVGTPPTVRIDTPKAGSLFAVGRPLIYNGSGWDWTGAALPAGSFSWTFYLRHQTHFHPYFGPVNGVKGGRLDTTLGTHGFVDDTKLLVTLTVTDKDGLQTTANALVSPGNGIEAKAWMAPGL